MFCMYNSEEYVPVSGINRVLNKFGMTLLSIETNGNRVNSCSYQMKYNNFEIWLWDKKKMLTGVVIGR
jgi:hypothetical protein